MGCCAFIFLALLIFDFVVIRRNKLKSVAEQIAIIVVSTCVIIMIICGVQLLKVLNADISFVCSDKGRVQALSNSQIELTTYFCPEKRTQCSSCETNIPSTAKIVASSIVLDVLFVLFEALNYAVDNKYLPAAESVKLAEVKNS